MANFAGRFVLPNIVFVIKSLSTKIGVGSALSFYPLIFSGMVHAAPPVIAPTTLPTGGQVVAGNATISSSSTANTAVMNVNQTSQRAVVNWDSFNVGKNAAVNFNQPNANAVTLNRVTGASASVIEGAIRANGQVILVNPNGVTFGKGSEVHAAAVVASTLNMADKEFMEGKHNFKDDGSGVGSKVGKITNKGTISTNNENGEGGFIALLAPEVRNQGYLLAQKGGTVAIGSGSHITLHIQGQSLVAIKVEESVYNGLISNKRIIEAPSGLVVLATGAANQLMAGVIKNTGKISADSLVNNGGVIELVAKNITQAGTISANSQTKEGGQINLTGQDITLAKNSQTTATGATAGGQVNIGLANTQVSGGTQINTPTNNQTAASIKANADAAANTKQLAKTVTIEQDSTIDTSATQSGNGGAIAIWSELKTTVAGILKSMGGALSGNGGFIETSSKGQVSLGSTANINTSANNPTGKAGTWLLDPVDLLINTLAADVISTVLSTSNVTIAVTENTTTCKAGFGSCVVNGSGNLAIAADIVKAGSAYTTLTLSSINTFTLFSSILGQNLDVMIIAPSTHLMSSSHIEATTVTVQAQTIISAGTIQTSRYLFGGAADSLGNAIKLLAEAIFVTGTLKINALPFGSLPITGSADLNSTTYNVDLGLNKIYSSSAANDPFALVVTPASQALSNVINLTASAASPGVAMLILESGAEVLADGTTGGSIYFKGSSIEARAGSLVRANGTSGAGGTIGMKADDILIAGIVTAGGTTKGGDITFISTGGPLDLRGSVIQANGDSGLGGSINAKALGVSSLLASAAGLGGSGIDLSRVLFVRESMTSASAGSVNLGYELFDTAGSSVTLGTGTYANLAITGTPRYVDSANTISNLIGAGTYSNLVVEGLALSGLDAGHFMLVAVPVSLTVSPALPAPITIPDASGSTASSIANMLAAPPPPPPPPPPINMMFAPPLPAPAPAKLSIALAAGPANVAPSPAPANAPPAAGGEVAAPPPVHSNALSVLPDGSMALVPAAPPPIAARTGSTVAPPPAQSPPPALKGEAPSKGEGKTNPEGRKNGPSSDLVEKKGSKDEPRKSESDSKKYVSKYANGFQKGDKPGPKEGPKDAASKTASENKSRPPREGKYSSRVNAMNNNPVAIAPMLQNPFAATISPFPVGVPHEAPTHVVLRGGDSLAQSYDDVPSIRNSGVANVARSRNSENFHESLESVNLMSTLNLFILH